MLHMGHIWIMRWVTDRSQMGNIWLTGLVIDGSYMSAGWIKYESQLGHTLATLLSTKFLNFFSKLHIGYEK